MFRPFFFIRAQLAFEPQIGSRILSTGSGAGDRSRIRPAPVQTDESFRRGADEAGVIEAE
jgi:hypothetical protein